MFEFMLDWLECDSPNDVREVSKRIGPEVDVEGFLRSISNKDGNGFREGLGIRNAVRIECGGYLPTAMENCTGLMGLNDRSNMYCSYNASAHDFHIVPLFKGEAKNYVEACNGAFRAVGKTVEATLPSVQFKERSGNTKGSLTCHRYKYADDLDDRWQYLIGFNRLTCSDNREITNHLGLVQFMRYAIVEEDTTSLRNAVNWSANREFKMMYPSSAEDYSCRYDAATGHCVYNAPYAVNPNGKDADANAKEIAEAFVRFIRFFQDGKLEITGDPE